MNLKSIYANKKLFAFFAGAFAALAFAPINFFLALTISFPALFWLIEKTEAKKQIFWLGFFFGFGHFIAGIYWISISLLVDADQFAWLIPFALTIIPGILAIYVGLAALTFRFFCDRFQVEQISKKLVIFSFCWLFFEFLRANLLSGFPWNLMGYAWLFSVDFAQLGSVFGIYGLSFFAVLTGLFPIIFFEKKLTKADKIFAASVILFLCGNLIFGHFHIDDSKIITEKNSKLRLVQSNIKQEIKWDEEQKYKDFFRQIKMSNAEDSAGVKAIIWSETAVPYVIDDHPILLNYLKSATPKDGVLITGGLRVEDKKVWNSVFVIGQNGVEKYYDKHHLVPFGEYVPLHKFLSFLFLDNVVDGITGGGSGFNEGEGAKTLLVDGFSFSPLVCYEVIFSDEIVDHQNRPDLLINLTNDAWFGNSSGPYQHLNMARMRAIEYGLPLVRVANTGISALIDPFGRVLKKVNLNQTEVVDVDLIKNSGTTIYATYRFIPLLILLILFLFFLTFLSPQNGNSKNLPNRSADRKKT